MKKMSKDRKEYFKKYNREYYSKHKEEILKKQKQYQTENKEKVSERHRKYNQKIKAGNSILTELEKKLNQEINEGRSEENIWLMGVYDYAKEILFFIQELKEEYK